jgi:tRNA nucleotidyltransferase (CCA-adding enzyme)
MKLELPEPLAAALPVIRRLREHKFEAVFVGGCVRDTLLGLPIKDVDIAASAVPEQVIALFDRCIPTGMQHGTVTVMHGKTGYEITTFREESQYERHRRPEAVQYITSLEGDLQRRDFTVNAMALTADGELLDPYGGAADLQRSILRCVGQADARFQEDALRMVRAVRFIGIYGFTPALGTWRALIRHRELLRYVALERVQAELDKMLAGSDPLRSLHIAAASGLLVYLKEPLPVAVLQAVSSSAAGKQGYGGLNRLNGLQSLDLRYAAVAMALGLTEQQTAQTLTTLKFANQRIKQIRAIVACDWHMKQALSVMDKPELRLAWLQYVLQAGKQTAMQWLEIAVGMNADGESSSSEKLKWLAEWLLEMPISALKELELGGNDLTRALQRQAGPWVKEMLQSLLFAVASGSLPNDKQQLLQQAQRLNKEDKHDEV